MASRYLIQVVDKLSGDVVQWEPGRAVEHDFIEDCLKRVRAKGVGFGRTTDHVLLDVEEAIEETLLSLKRLVR